MDLISEAGRDGEQQRGRCRGKSYLKDSAWVRQIEKGRKISVNFAEMGEMPGGFPQAAIAMPSGESGLIPMRGKLLRLFCAPRECYRVILRWVLRAWVAAGAGCGSRILLEVQC